MVRTDEAFTLTQMLLKVIIARFTGPGLNALARFGLAHQLHCLKAHAHPFCDTLTVLLPVIGFILQAMVDMEGKQMLTWN